MFRKRMRGDVSSPPLTLWQRAKVMWILKKLKNGYRLWVIENDGKRRLNIVPQSKIEDMMFCNTEYELIKDK